MARGDWYVHLALLMPDHCHALVSCPRDADMRKAVANWKEIVSKRTGVRWQRDFFDHRLRAAESYEEKAHYIRMNPVRGGLTSDPNSWPHVWEPR
jgi:putative transposase